MKKETKSICINFKKELQKFTDSVYSLSRDDRLSHQEAFLLYVAEIINQLYNTSNDILKCQEEEIKEIGELVQNIFIQTIVTKQDKPLNFLKAVKSFSKQDPSSSDLSSILFEYIIHPESTKSFIRELEILTDDLDSALKKIA